MKWLLLFFVPLFSSANECSPVDLRAKIGPPLHQGDSSYCFAHTASSLIQAKLGMRVSPMQLATHFLLANPSELRGPVPPEVRARITPAFLQFWRHNRNEPGNFTPDRILGEQGLLDTGGEELPTILLTNFLGLCPESRLPTGEGVYLPYLESIRAFHADRTRNGIPPEEFRNAIGEVIDPAARSMAWSYRRWVESRCGALIKPNRPLLPKMASLASDLKAFRRLEAGDMLPPSGRRHLERAIQASLDRGQPIAIGYAMADIIPEKALAAPLEMDHASVLAGRREVGGKCYYFLRNSFGNDLEGYHPRLQGRLESGGAWVLLEEIPSLYNVTWLE